jgi:hypothetical protein
MKVKDAIKSLLSQYGNSEEEIIIAWWDFDYFDHVINDYETFAETVELWEHEFDWSGSHDDIVWWLTHRNEDE